MRLSTKLIYLARALPAPPIRDVGLTGFAQAMPDAYKVPSDAVRAHRRFYIAEKVHIATWTKRQVPDWLRAGYSNTD